MLLQCCLPLGRAAGFAKTIIQINSSKPALKLDFSWSVEQVILMATKIERLMGHLASSWGLVKL